MDKKNIGIFSFALLFIVGILSFIWIGEYDKLEETQPKIKNQIEGTVLSVNKEYISVQDKNQIIYTFSNSNFSLNVGDSILLEYFGILNKDSERQENKVVNITTTSKTIDGIPLDWQDNGIFKAFYNQAYKKVQTMSLSDKIGQLLLVRYPSFNATEHLKAYSFGGFVFFEKDFKNKTEQEVKNMIKKLQDESTIPLLTAVDEEGGKIVRVSSNPNLVSTKFLSSKELYDLGGFPKISEDTKNKSKILYNLGLNLNLAPVVDVSTNPNDYMYERSFGKSTDLTNTYAKTVIEASKGTGVSYTLKHFPGYGNNPDTHTSGTTDSRTFDDLLKNDIPPFENGIHAGAEAVLVSHNTVTSIDPNQPASLSSAVHNVLRNRLDFTGIIITDDIAMGATNTIDNKTVKAILAGNDLIITTDYEESIKEIKKAIADGVLSEDLISKLAFRNLAWKYYKGLIHENEK